MKPRVVIGSRGSELALTQTNLVAQLLREASPGLEVEVIVIKTKGDKILDTPLNLIGGKGLFTKELEVALIDKRIDLAVHSMKDLPTESPPGLTISAVPQRATPNDAFVSKKWPSLDDLPEGATVGTSSLRRKAQLLAHRNDLDVQSIRGNVGTRLKRVEDGDVDATILAAAGLERLGKADAITHLMDDATMMPAVAQGALAIQTRADDPDVVGLVAKISHEDTASETTAERALLSALGGGCQTPIGAIARIEKGTLTLRARVCSLEGDVILDTTVSGKPSEAESLGKRAAATLFEQGAREVIAAAEESSAPPEQSLKGLRVVVTRPRGQGKKLVDALERLGAEVITFPTIEVRPVAVNDSLDDLGSYDWVVFTSTNAVPMFLRHLEGQDEKREALRRVNICAVGTATADALREHGLDVDLVPGTFVAEALFDAILQAEETLEGKRFLLPRGNLARDFLPKALRERGAEVTELTVYETVAPETTQDEVDALINKKPHVVTFTSSSTAENMVKVLGPESLNALKNDATFASIGPVTTATARENDLPIAIESRNHDVPSLVQAIQDWAEAKPLKRC